MVIMIRKSHEQRVQQKIMIMMMMMTMISYCLLGCVSGIALLYDASAVNDAELDPVKAGIEYSVLVLRRRNIWDDIAILAVDNQTCPPPVVGYSISRNPRELRRTTTLTMSLHPVTPPSDGIVRRDTPFYVKLGQGAAFEVPAGCNSSSSLLWKVGEYDENNMNTPIVTTGGQMGDLQGSGIFMAGSVGWSPGTNRFSACPISPTAVANATCRPIVAVHYPRPDGLTGFFLFGLGYPGFSSPLSPYANNGLRFQFVKKNN